MDLDGRGPDPYYPFTRLQVLADDLYDALPGLNSVEREEWLRAYLRREIQRRRREVGESWRSLDETLEKRENGRRTTAYVPGRSPNVEGSRSEPIRSRCVVAA